MQVLPDIPEQAMVSLGELKKHPKNYRLHSRMQVNKIAASLKAHGQRKPVPVRRSPDGLIIVAGHGVVSGLTMLANENLAKYGQCWVTYVPDSWDDWHVIEYMVADNKTSEGAAEDLELLSEIVDHQVNLGNDIASLGLTAEDLKRLTMPEKVPEQLGEIPFTEELMENHQYVVLYFNNDIDWLYLQTVYPLPRVKCLGSKPGYGRTGVGRVVNGIDFLQKIRAQYNSPSAQQEHDLPSEGAES